MPSCEEKKSCQPSRGCFPSYGGNNYILFLKCYYLIFSLERSLWFTVLNLEMLAKLKKITQKKYPGDIHFCTCDIVLKALCDIKIDSIYMSVETSFFKYRIDEQNRIKT